MQNVSQQWIEAQSGIIVPEAFVRIACRVYDPTVQQLAVASSSSAIEESDVIALTQETENGDSPAYLGLNTWILDGSNGEYIDEATDVRFVGDAVSDADCEFPSTQAISVDWDSAQTSVIKGITIQFDPLGIAADFTVSVKNGGNTVWTESVSSNYSEKYELLRDFSGFDGIVIEFVKSALPQTRVSVHSIFIGVSLVFEKRDLVSYNAKGIVDLLSSSLPSYGVSFTLANIGNRFNPDNPTGLTKYLSERQEVDVSYGYRIDNAIEWIPGGVYWLSSWDTPQNGITSKLTARGLTEWMDDTYTGTLNDTLYNIAAAAFTQAGIPQLNDGTNRWEIDSSLASITVNITDDYSHTIAETLQLCANAAKCVMYEDRNGVFHITPLGGTLRAFSIDNTNSYKYGDYAYDKPFKAVSVNDGLGEVTKSEVGETVKITNPMVQDSNHATAVAKWAGETLEGRKTISGEWRADPRIDVLDNVIVKNKYAQNVVVMTTVDLSFSGAFKGSYKGRVISSIFEGTEYAGDWYSDELGGDGV